MHKKTHDYVLFLYAFLNLNTVHWTTIAKQPRHENCSQCNGHYNRNSIQIAQNQTVPKTYLKVGNGPWRDSFQTKHSGNLFAYCMSHSSHLSTSLSLLSISTVSWVERPLTQILPLRPTENSNGRVFPITFSNESSANNLQKPKQ